MFNLRSYAQILCLLGNILYTILKVVFHRWSSFIDCRLLSKVVFCHRSSSVRARLPSKVIFRQKSSSVNGHLLSKVVFHQRSSSIKGRLPSKVVFCQKSSSVKGHIPLKIVILFWVIFIFGFYCYGIAHLSLSLFVSSSWSTTMTSIIFLFELVNLNDLNEVWRSSATSPKKM